MKVLVGTKNQGKVLGVKQAFFKYFSNIEIEGISVNSCVSDEPVNKEIYIGALKRVDNLIKYVSDRGLEADYFVGVESGITNLLGKWMNISIVVIKNKYGTFSWGMSPGYPIPDKYVEEIKRDSLGIVMDRIFAGDKLYSGKGGIQFLTHNEISRIDLTKEATMMALIQFINGDVWIDNSIERSDYNG